MSRLLPPALVSVLLLGPLSAAQAVDINVVGLFQNKAVLVVDGGPPKTYSSGSTVTDGIKLISVTNNGAVLDIHGKRETLAMGQHINRSTGSGRSNATLQPDGQGHYVVQGQINGGAVRMLLDTGATSVAIPATDAIRLGIDYKKGHPMHVTTANGTAPAFRVMLDRVKVGDIEINQVEAVVQEQGLPIILLGMSFLNRTEMRLEGQQMMLTKRY